MKAFQKLSQYFRNLSKTKKILFLSIFAFLIGFNSYFALLYISVNIYKPLSPVEVEEKIEEYTKDTKESQVQGATTENLIHDIPLHITHPKTRSRFRNLRRWSLKFRKRYLASISRER